MQLYEIAGIFIIVVLVVITIFEYRLIKTHKSLIITCNKIRKKLYETSNKISKTKDEDEIYAIVLDAIIELIPNATKGSVLLMNEEGNFRFQVVKGYDLELKKLTLKKEEVYLYHLNDFQETVIISNPREFDRENAGEETLKEIKKINALDICCTISAPIYNDDSLIGLINVDTDKSNYVFTQDDLELMNQIKCELELSIKNALAQNQLKYLVNFDELTGVKSRRILIEEFEHELQRISEEKKKLCFAMIDMDNFKYYNDNYGHNFGDRALKKFSHILNSAVRERDIVARFAGDEFIILFKDCDIELAQKIMDSINDRIKLEKLNGIVLNFSYGICEVSSNDNMNFEKALAIADSKMYENKKLKKFI